MQRKMCGRSCTMLCRRASPLETNYDWLCWAVRLHAAAEPAEDEMDKESSFHLAHNFFTVASKAPVPHVVSCYRNSLTSLD